MLFGNLKLWAILHFIKKIPKTEPYCAMHSLRKENMHFCCFSFSVSFRLSQGLLVWQQITRTFYSLPFFLPKYLLHAMIFTLLLFYTCAAMPLFISPLWDFVHSRFFFPLPFLPCFHPVTYPLFLSFALSSLFIPPDLSPLLSPDFLLFFLHLRFLPYYLPWPFFFTYSPFSFFYFSLSSFLCNFVPFTFPWPFYPFSPLFFHYCCFPAIFPPISSFLHLFCLFPFPWSSPLFCSPFFIHLTFVLFTFLCPFSPFPFSPLSLIFLPF